LVSNYRICEFTETGAVTQRVIEGHNKSHHYDRTEARKSKSIGQYDCKLFFHLNEQMQLIVQIVYLSGQRDFDSTTKSNASTGEEYCE